jgi:hypothetical protein
VTTALYFVFRCFFVSLVSVCSSVEIYYKFFVLQFFCCNVTLPFALNDMILSAFVYSDCTICIEWWLCLHVALRNGWKLISPSKSFVVYAATSTEKHQWMSHIKKCVDDLLIKRKHFWDCWKLATYCTSDRKTKCTADWHRARANLVYIYVIYELYVFWEQSSLSPSHTLSHNFEVVGTC